MNYKWVFPDQFWLVIDHENDGEVRGAFTTERGAVTRATVLNYKTPDKVPPRYEVFKMEED